MDPPDISYIASQLGNHWFVFGVNLGFSNAQLENLKEIYQFRPNDRNYVMLHKWYQQAERTVTNAKTLLASYLEEAGCKHLADEINQDTSTGEDEAKFSISKEELEKLDKAMKNIDFDIKENQQSVFVGQKIKRIINCQKCQRLFRRPKNLPCGHTFCQGCIVSILQANEKKCPSCKECIMLKKEHEIDKLTTNSLISDLVEINKKYEFWPLNNTSNVSCDMCSKPESSDFCVDCLKYMCRTCSLSHAKWPALRAHTTLEVNSENEPIIELRKKVPQCKAHGKAVVAFCSTCHIGVCENCRDSCPEEHVFVDLHSHCKDKRKEINTIIKSYSELIQEYSECVDKYDEKKQKLQEEKEEALMETESILNLVQVILTRKVSGMKSEIDGKYSRKCQQLDSEIENVLKEKSKLLTRVEYLKFLHEYGSDAHIVTECDENMSCCTAMGVKPNVDNLHIFSIDFRRNPSLEQMILGLNIGTLDNYHIEGDAEIIEASRFDLDVKESPISQTTDIESCKADIINENEGKQQIHLSLRSQLSRRPPPPLSLSLEILSPPLPPRDHCIQPSYAESSKRRRRIEKENKDEHLHEQFFAYDRKAKSLDWINNLNLQEDIHFDPKDMQDEESRVHETSNDLTYHYAGLDISGDHSFQSDTPITEAETHDESCRSEGEQMSKKSKNSKENYFKSQAQAQQKEVCNSTQKTAKMSTSRRERMLFDFNIIVSGMAVSTDDIALISFNSKCINIFHYNTQTFSSLKQECKAIGAPFDGVYSQDKDFVTGLFFTETDEEKRGVRILYKKNTKLKLVYFTTRVEDPRGISANHQHVFVCDRSKCSILVFNKDGELILSVSKKYSRFDIPTYVYAYRTIQLIVTDPNTHSVRALSGIDDMCTVVNMYRSSDFMLERKMNPGKCCVDNDGTVLIPNRNNCEILNCRTKQALNLTFLRTLGESPVAVARLNSTNFVLATTHGKIFVF